MILFSILGRIAFVAGRRSSAPLNRLTVAARKRGKKSSAPAIDPAVLHDRQLIDRCLAGETVAWSELYHHCQEPLLAAIRSFLRDSVADAHLVDEIAARVWYLVVRSNSELLARFDVTRNCRLTTFLSVLAKSEAKQYFRAERRRRTREEVASKREADLPDAMGVASSLSQADFLASLSPSERTYYEKVLTSSRSNDADLYTIENSWQLRHRVRKKLDIFFNRNG